MSSRPSHPSPCHHRCVMRHLFEAIAHLIYRVRQSPGCHRRRRERKEEEKRDNEAEDPGERTVAHSTHGQRKEREEGRTLRLAAPLDCCYPRNANIFSINLKTMRRQEPTEHHSQSSPFR